MSFNREWKTKPRRDETTPSRVTNRNKETTTPGRRDDGAKQRSAKRKRLNDESNMSSTICLHRSREQLGLSIRKRNVMSSVRVTQAIRSLKKLLPARKASVIRWKKIAILSNGSGFPFQKIFTRSVRKARTTNSKTFVICSNGSSYPFKTTVSPATIQNHFHLSPLATNLSQKIKRCLPSTHEFSWYIFCW